MFQHILVPVDFSERNRRSIEIAVNMAAIDHGRVCLLHVIEVIADMPLAEFQKFYLPLEREAENKLYALSAVHKDTTITIDQTVIYGNRVQEIVRLAAEQGADLIVMNSHKIDLQNPSQDWATISYKVSILAACPVLLVK